MTPDEHDTCFRFARESGARWGREMRDRDGPYWLPDMPQATALVSDLTSEPVLLNRLARVCASAAASAYRGGNGLACSPAPPDADVVRVSRYLEAIAMDHLVGADCPGATEWRDVAIAAIVAGLDPSKVPPP